MSCFRQQIVYCLDHDHLIQAGDPDDDSTWAWGNKHSNNYIHLIRDDGSMYIEHIKNLLVAETLLEKGEIFPARRER